MATLVFSALGTLVGGPLGGAIGSLIGREVDRAIIGPTTREGARLKELPVSTSSYGQPIARLFGTTRAAGTILWATPIKESSETMAGSKGQPGTRHYSYAISLAVALSSRPIAGVGRIWADGNLLRGQAGDLKTAGALRLHLGHADQAPDRLLAAALGPHCPAHRGLAYAVFEDLALGDFGNRIPALSFEVLADGAGQDFLAELVATQSVSSLGPPIPAAAPIMGFAQEGGSIAAVLDSLDGLLPLVVETGAEGPIVVGVTAEAPVATLPPAIAWPDGDFGTRTGRALTRNHAAAPTGLRYYDPARDYQPGLQRRVGKALQGGERVLELPATLSAEGAATLVTEAGLRARSSAEQARLRIASLDPAFLPGRRVALAGEGQWQVVSWEWRSGGVELALKRPAVSPAQAAPADPGLPWQPADRLPAHSVLHAFELPWDGSGAPDAARLHVALGHGEGRWAGAALYVESAGALVPIGSGGPVGAITGILVTPLGPSPALMVEPAATIAIRCDDPDALLGSIDHERLASGGNRLLVGEEIIQFLTAEPIGDGLWQLSGLLRGRGGTEAEARAGHAAGAATALLDARLQLFDASTVNPDGHRLAAIGTGDSEPVFAMVMAPGRSRRPPTPVHPFAQVRADGALALEWTRRARGQWGWADGVATPLVEESESYEVGAGPVAAPLASWSSAVQAMVLTADQLAALPRPTELWVRQIGRHARSDALQLCTLA